MVVIGLLVCVVVGLCLWCIWRFFSKKRSGSGGKKKGGGGKSTEERNGTGHMIGDNDEDFLVDNEEEPDAMDIKDEPIKGAGGPKFALFATSKAKNQRVCFSNVDFSL